MGVVEPFHYVHLAVDFLQVPSVQLGFIYDFNGHLKRRTKENKLIVCVEQVYTFLFLNVCSRVINRLERNQITATMCVNV